jgi:hypothetical protein
MKFTATAENTPAAVVEAMVADYETSRLKNCGQACQAPKMRWIWFFPMPKMRSWSYTMTKIQARKIEKITIPAFSQVTIYPGDGSELILTNSHRKQITLESNDDWYTWRQSTSHHPGVVTEDWGMGEMKKYGGLTEDFGCPEVAARCKQVEK